MSSDTSIDEQRNFGPSWLALDLPAGRAQPSWRRWAIASVVAGLTSIGACLGIARMTIAAFPSLAGYEHLHFSDYTRLTLIGVVAAVVVWPMLTLISSRARRLYLIGAAVALVVSFAPDAWILRQGQPGVGVAALAVMHIAVAVATVTSVQLLAPQPRRVRSRG